MHSKTFSELGLIPQILQAVEDQDYKTPTPIQQQTIPHLLHGRDLLGCAQTGTGKTAAFALPILQNLTKTGAVPGRGDVRSLILTPTRELALQILESFRVYGRNLNLRSMAIFGGVNQNPQVKTLRDGVDILVATPGRLLDLINQRFVNLKKVEIFVLDEADRMLDMGFFRDIKKILPLLPKKRQNLFFSATMPPEIEKLAATILINPEKVEVTPRSSTVELINQIVMHVPRDRKQDLLIHLLKNQAISKVLVFSRTKHGANRIVEKLQRARISAEAIHGNKSQSARVKALESFRAGTVRVLVATDIAARGIDIDEISHVINFELPNVPESYVHRIGRTARAGESGHAISFCDGEERSFLKSIERLIKKEIQVVVDHEFGSTVPTPRPMQSLQNHQLSRHNSANRHHSHGLHTFHKLKSSKPSGTSDQRQNSAKPHGVKTHGAKPHGAKHHGPKSHSK